jgi:hypothetical protein
MAVTRNKCDDSRFGSFAAFSRRLTSSQIALLVKPLPVSCFVFRTVDRNNDRSFASAPMPAAAR